MNMPVSVRPPASEGQQLLAVPEDGQLFTPEQQEFIAKLIDIANGVKLIKKVDPEASKMSVLFRSYPSLKSADDDRAKIILTRKGIEATIKKLCPSLGNVTFKDLPEILNQHMKEVDDAIHEARGSLKKIGYQPILEAEPNPETREGAATIYIKEKIPQKNLLGDIPALYKALKILENADRWLEEVIAQYNGLST